jgi:hypothetical protein
MINVKVLGTAITRQRRIDCNNTFIFIIGKSRALKMISMFIEHISGLQTPGMTIIFVIYSLIRDVLLGDF